MHQLFWTPIAINFFIEFLMVALLTGYFAVRLISALPTQVNIRITSCLFATFAAATIGTLLQFLANTLHPDYVDFSLPFVSVLGAIAMSGFLLFTFYFQRQVRTHKWVEICIIVGIVLLVGTESLVALARFRLLSRGIVEYRDYWLSIPYTLGFFAAHLILLARLIETLAYTHHRLRHQCIGLAIQAIVVPSIKLEQQAAALRAFFYMTMIPATIGIVLILRGLGIIDWSVTELMNCWLTLLTYVGFMLVYVNHTPEYSSFQFKLVGITLAVVFSILSGISWVIGQTYINAYQNHQQPAVHSTLHFSPIQDGYSFQQMPYHFRQEIGQKQSLDHALVLPFDFPYYGATYHTLYPQLAGMVGLHDVPRWRDVQHQ